MTIYLRPATVADAPFLADVVIQATIDQGRFPSDVGEDEYRADYEAWTRETVLGRIPGCTLSVVEKDGLPIGRLRVVRDGTSITLAGIQLLPAFQNQRIGSGLVEDLKREAQQRNVPLLIGVEKDNPDAQRFYARLGCCVVGEDGNEYQLEWRNRSL